MKFPRFRAKYGKNYDLKNNKFINLNKYLANSLGKNFLDNKNEGEIENKMGGTKRTNLTISEVDENEEKNKNTRKGVISQLKPKGKANLNMNRKMKEILGKQYKILLDDPLNPYGTFWPSNFLKAGYDTGFEYEDFQSGVPVLKLRNLGRKQLPPLKTFKKKILHFNNDSTVYSPNRNRKFKNLYPGTASKKYLHEEIWESNRTNKSENAKIFNVKLNNNIEEIKKLKGITVENEHN